MKGMFASGNDVRAGVVVFWTARQNRVRNQILEAKVLVPPLAASQGISAKGVQFAHARAAK